MLCNSLGYAQTTHVVQRGETYDLIARRYGIPLSELMAANPDSDGCFVGMEVNIPEGRKKADHIVTVTPRDMSLLDAASHYVKDGKYKKATSAYSDVIKVSPSAAAYFGRGISYYNREKYKSAIEDFEMALRSGDCTSDMKERSKQLIANAESLRAEQHERRNSFWGSLAAVVVGAAAVTASAALAADNSGNAMYMPPSKMNGFQRDTSMDYLLDPRYAIMQVQQEEMAEYQQFKQLTGQDITFEQYQMFKYTPYESESGSGTTLSESDTPNEYKGELRPDQYEAQYRRYEHLAESHFNSITVAGGIKVQDKNGNISGRTNGETKAWAYTDLKRMLRNAQNEMRKIRLEAEKYGVHIVQSKWETATANY